MSVLITGGAGFLGLRLAQLLKDTGERVVLVDRRFPDAAREIGTTGADLVTADVTDQAGLWAAIERARPDGIIHLAAILSTECEDDPARAFAINVGGTINVLEGARRFGVKKVMATSSVAVCEAVEPCAPIDEDQPLAPLGVYGMTKATLEAWCALYHRRWELDTRVARPGAVVGPGRVASGAASNFTTAILAEPFQGRPYVCPVEEADSAPVVYHTDLLDGLFRLYRAPVVSSRVYHLGACSVTAGELARAVRERRPDAQITFQPDATAGFVVSRWRYVVQDNRRAMRDFGYSPKYDTAAKLVEAFAAEVAGKGPE